MARIIGRQHWRRWFKKEFLIWWTLLGVVAGIGLGGGLYNVGCSDLTIELIGTNASSYIFTVENKIHH